MKAGKTLELSIHVINFIETHEKVGALNTCAFFPDVTFHKPEELLVKQDEDMSDKLYDAWVLEFKKLSWINQPVRIEPGKVLRYIGNGGHACFAMNISDLAEQEFIDFPALNAFLKEFAKEWTRSTLAVLVWRYVHQ